MVNAGLRLAIESAIKIGPETLRKQRPALTNAKGIFAMATTQIRPIRIDGNLAYITLSRGYVATIDAIDLPLVGHLKWWASSEKYTVYAVHSQWINGKKRGLRLHRVIMRAPDDMFVDHINGDGLDNRRANLRIATASQNQHNKRKYNNNKSGFKGVSWHNSGKKWCAQIRLNGKSIYLGLFDNPEDAHAAYCEASSKIHGEYGRVG